MSDPVDVQIRNYEERLKRAMLKSDVSSLDELLSPSLIFTNHLGQVMTKEDDLEAHRSGMLNISEIIISDQNIVVLNEVVVVSVQARISGSFSEVASNSDFRFTRVWVNKENMKWQVIAGHSSLVI